MLAWAKMIRDYLRCQKGQGMVEYGLILALVAIAAVAGFTAMGDGLSAQLSAIVDRLAH